jgi:hypothetical protein
MEVLKHPPRIHLNRDIIRISPRGAPVIELNPQSKQEQKQTILFSHPPRINLTKDIISTLPGRPPHIFLHPKRQEEQAA